MPAYMIVEAKPKDPKIYAQYLAKVPEIAARYGGRYLARTSRIEPLSGDWNPERMILLEFPSVDDIHQWLASAEYRAISPWREAGADTRAVILEGGID